MYLSVYFKMLPLALNCGVISVKCFGK